VLRASKGILAIVILRTLDTNGCGVCLLKGIGIVFKIFGFDKVEIEKGGRIEGETCIRE
jgi:hypothetical protein